MHMSQESALKARIAELEAQLAKAATSRIQMKVSESGYVDIYGIVGKGRFPVSLTAAGWGVVLDEQGPAIKAFIASNTALLTAKQAAYLSKRSSVAVG